MLRMYGVYAEIRASRVTKVRDVFIGRKCLAQLPLSHVHKEFHFFAVNVRSVPSQPGAVTTAPMLEPQAILALFDVKHVEIQR